MEPVLLTFAIVYAVALLVLLIFDFVVLFTEVKGLSEQEMEAFIIILIGTFIPVINIVLLWMLIREIINYLKRRRNEKQ